MRLRWIPDAGEERLADDEAKARGRDYLYDDLVRAPRRRRHDRLRAALPARRRRTTRSTIRPPSGPTSASSSAPGGWRSRARIDDPERDDHIDVFDPLRLPDGVEPSDDPILHARRQAYSVSAYRRWGRERGPVPE